jgi:hypothetical protein
MRHPLGEEAITTPWIAASSHTDSLSERGSCVCGTRVLLLEDGRGRHIQPGQFVNVRVLEAEDVVVLYAVALTIETGGLLRLSEPDRGLSRISDVPASLGRLRRNALVTAERDGNAWKVGWGTRALNIAREAGVDVAAA